MFDNPRPVRSEEFGSDRTRICEYLNCVIYWKFTEPYLVVIVPYVGLVESRVEDRAISIDVNTVRICSVRLGTAD